MLYLMMDRGNQLVKVGFSDGVANLSRRRKAYFSYNPSTIMRSSCAGSTALEKECHKKLVADGAERITGTEWFLVSPALFNALYTQGMGHFSIRTPIHFLEEF